MAADYIESVLSPEQGSALAEHCKRTGKQVLRVWKTDKNVYARLVIFGQHTETRYWYIPKGFKPRRKPQWKKVG